MDFGTHLLSGIILAYILTDFNSWMWVLIIIFALLPDLIGELFYQIGRITKGYKIKLIYDQEITSSSLYLKNSKYMIPYNFLHSLLAIGLLYIFSLPFELIIAYAIHIVLDLVSHSRDSWGIMIFWPFNKKRFGPKKNWWEWKFLKNTSVFYFNLITYIITVIIFLILKIFLNKF